MLWYKQKKHKKTEAGYASAKYLNFYTKNGKINVGDCVAWQQVQLQ